MLAGLAWYRPSMLLEYFGKDAIRGTPVGLKVEV